MPEFDNIVAEVDLVDFVTDEPEAVELADIIDSDGDRPDPKSDPIGKPSALGPPRYIEMTIIGQDHTVLDDTGHILTANVRVDADRFRAPFQTHRFNVVSFDPKGAGPGPELKLLDESGRFVDRFARARDNILLTNNDFHAQNAFAIASRTLAAFESALGRRVPWDFDGHQLFVVPHGEIKANAKYAPGSHALVFGVVLKGDGTTAYSCLSHDVVAHETSHAILDGLRPGFFTPSLPDQGAFHEGFADCVALLSVFALPEVLTAALRKLTDKKSLETSDVTRRKLQDSVLFGMADGFGQEVHGRTGEALRRSIKLPRNGDWRKDPEFNFVHRRGEVLVAAISQTLLDMWFERLGKLMEGGPATVTLAAEEGAKSAQHLLQMLIRAIDYTPPVEFEFEDFVDAILRSDFQMAPDDSHGYRDAVRAGFARYGIGLPEESIINVSALKRKPRYDRFNFAALQSDPDEVFRFIWENDQLLRMRLDFQTDVEAVRPSVRVGPDGFVVRETVVTYIQEVDASVGDFEAFSQDPLNRYWTVEQVERKQEPPAFKPPKNLDRSTKLRIYGGGAIIFDQFGRPKFHQHKPLLDWKRQSTRLGFLVRTAKASRDARLGVTSFDGQEPLAAMHESDRLAVERW